MNRDKKLIIHIGVSRTATTNLQTRLFPQLHNDGVINYLGKAADNVYCKINNGDNIKKTLIRYNFKLRIYICERGE